MDGYDLDDTLAAANYKQANVKSLAQIFAAAPVIYQPHEPFVIITGRPNQDKAQREATSAWLAQHEPNHRKVYFVTGSEKEKVSQKAQIIGRLHLATYTDNNPKVLSELKKLLPRVQFFIMRDGQRTAF